MGRLYHESMASGYEATGRRRQKSRTREALVAAARKVLAEGGAVSIEGVAHEADVSRTTAYRYFPNPDALVHAAHPEIELTSLLDDDAPSDVPERLDLVLTEHFRLVRAWEPQLRASLAAALRSEAARPVLRRGRVIGWIEDALAPLVESHSQVDIHAVAVRIRAVAGIEPLVWLVDVGGLSRRAAFDAMRANAHAVLAAVLDTR